MYTPERLMFLAVWSHRLEPSINVYLLATIDKVRGGEVRTCGLSFNLGGGRADYCRIVNSDPPSCSINSASVSQFHRVSVVIPPFRRPPPLTSTSAHAIASTAKASAWPTPTGVWFLEIFATVEWASFSISASGSVLMQINIFHIQIEQ